MLLVTAQKRILENEDGVPLDELDLAEELAILNTTDFVCDDPECDECGEDFEVEEEELVEFFATDLQD